MTLDVGRLTRDAQERGIHRKVIRTYKINPFCFQRYLSRITTELTRANEAERNEHRC